MFGLFSTVAMLIKEMIAFVSYIKNNAFPQPLSEGEEAECLRRLAEGDQEARNRLIEHNLRLVAHIVKMIKTQSEVRKSLSNQSFCYRW